jgi:hypothetical protein
MKNEFLVITGSLCLILALVEAWLLVVLVSNPGGRLARWIPGFRDLLKSHIDYLMMALFLFAFYLLFAHFQIRPPVLVILPLILGSLGNPMLFLIRAINPVWKDEPAPRFRLFMTVSCLLTTVGYGGSAWLVGSSALTLI